VSARVKCLLVDDLEENLLALAALLRRDDVEILKAKSGQEALELLLAHDVALAFLDVQMPEMDGFELAELMRGSARTRNVPIIFVTAGANDQRRVFKGYESGAVDFLHKPIETRVLQNKAEVFFQLYRQKQKLAEQLQTLTETLRLNEMFTAVLGHDLRNPLSAILTTANLLLLKTHDDAVRKAAGRIQSSGIRMSRLIEDTLDLARARLGGGIPLKREETDFGVVVQRVLQEHQAAYPGRRIEIYREGSLMGDWDSERLSQVASNLVGNALQHGDASVPVEVRVDGTDAQMLAFSVSSGGLISPDVLPTLFDPFRSGVRKPGRHEGLGLGLYIVQQIVHAHQGRVNVESHGGNRTQFRIEVPRYGDETSHSRMT
jgi:two-component system, sensor histidine kinase and response regulator